MLIQEAGPLYWNAILGTEKNMEHAFVNISSILHAFNLLMFKEIENYTLTYLIACTNFQFPEHR